MGASLNPTIGAWSRTRRPACYTRPRSTLLESQLKFALLASFAVDGCQARTCIATFSYSQRQSLVKRDLGLLTVTLAAITWGTIGVAVALLNRLTPPNALSVGFWRLALSAPVLLLLSRVYAGPHF